MRTRFSCLAAAAVACGEKTTDSTHSMHHGGPTGCGGEVVDVRPGLRHPCDAGSCTVEVVEATPAPPDRGPNTWTLRMLDQSDSIIPLALLEVAPFMPLHNHGTAPPTIQGKESDEGWSIGPVDLFMPGLWELRVRGVGTDSTEYSAAIAFCVEG